MTQNKTKKGIIYYRVSTEDQAQFGVSLEQQKKNCINYAEINGIEIMKMFHDDGVSAKTTERPSLQEMLKYCGKKGNEIDYVIVYKIDRLSRNVNDYTSILMLINKLKIKLVSTTEAIDDTPSGKFIGNIMAASAQFDNDLKSQRVSACMLEKVLQGYWCWKAPFGYVNKTNELNKKIIATDQKRASLITWAFEKFSTGIYTIEEVRRMVNKKGLRSWKGKEISSQSMNKIIRNKFYIGIMTTNGKEYEGGKHEYLVSDHIFYKCQNNLKGYDRYENISKNQISENFPLRHFVLCAYCGRPLTGYFSTGRHGGKFPYYRCYNKDCSSKKSIKKSSLENDFSNYLDDIIPKKNILDTFKKVIINVWEDKYKEINKQRMEIIKSLDDLKSEKLKLIDMKKRELLSDEDFTESFDILKQDIAQKQMIIDGNDIEEFNIDEAVSYVFDFISGIPEYWNKATYDQKVKLQGLIFPIKPTYDYTEFQTPKISLVLATKKELASSNSSMVAPRGIEPLFSG